MKRFRFKLERILELKKHGEKEWEIKLGQITVQCERVKKEITSLQVERRRSFSARLEGGVELLSVAESYISHLDGKIRSLSADLKTLEKKRLEIQEKYVEASRQRKVYDALKDKRAEEFRKEELKREYMEVDDLNTGAAARKAEDRNGGG